MGRRRAAARLASRWPSEVHAFGRPNELVKSNFGPAIAPTRQAPRQPREQTGARAHGLLLAPPSLARRPRAEMQINRLGARVSASPKHDDAPLSSARCRRRRLCLSARPPVSPAARPLVRPSARPHDRPAARLPGDGEARVGPAGRLGLSRRVPRPVGRRIGAAAGVGRHARARAKCRLGRAGNREEVTQLSRA